MDYTCVANELPAFVAISGADLERHARITTPYILEKGKPGRKAGGAKRWAFGLWADGCQATEGIGQAKSPSVPERSDPFLCWTLAFDPRTGLPRLR